MQAPGPGMPPAGGPGGAPAPGGVPGMPMPISPVIQAMQPRQYPNPMQMMQPVGKAAVMRMEMMAQQQAAAQAAPPAKGKGKAAPAAEKKEPPAA
jgi:hypothetical protein